MREDFDKLVGHEDLAPEERETLRRVHELIVEAGPPPGFSPARRPSAFGRTLMTGIGALAAATAVAAAAGVAAFGGWQLLGGQRAVSATSSNPRPALPRLGVLVDGQSLAGIRLGDTAAHVRALWGHHFTVCQGCYETTWFYTYPTGDPLGARVKFRDGRVTAVFTLGSPRGWHTSTGVRIGQLIDRSPGPGRKTKWSVCTGYGATSIDTGNAVTSILMQGKAVYGFSLTLPTEPVCQ